MTRHGLWKDRSCFITNKRFFYLRTDEHISTPLNHISGVTRSNNDKFYQVVVHVDNDRDFRLYTAKNNENLRDVFIYNLVLCYFKLMKKNLPIYGVDEQFLKEYEETYDEAL